jgi:hypothetical protein
MKGGTPIAPPAWARALLKKTLPSGPKGESILADLDDEFRVMANHRPGAARRWYASEAVRMAGHYLLHGLYPSAWRAMRIPPADALRESRGRGQMWAAWPREAGP